MKALVTPVCLSQSNGGGGGDDDDDNDNELSGRSAHTHKRTRAKATCKRLTEQRSIEFQCETEKERKMHRTTANK